jgi:hypothetical protein
MTPSGTPMPVNPNQTRRRRTADGAGRRAAAAAAAAASRATSANSSRSRSAAIHAAGQCRPARTPQQPGAGGNQAPVQMPAPTHPTGSPVNGQ